MEKLPTDELLRLAGIMAQDVISEVAVANSAVHLLMHDKTVPLDVRGKLSLLTEQLRSVAGRTKWFILMAHTQPELEDTDAPAVNVGEYLSELYGLFRALLPQNINFKMELGTDLWSARLSQGLSGRPVEFARQVSDAMPNGGTLLCRAANVDEVTCRSMSGLCLFGDYVLVELTDNGIAIPPALLERCL